MDFLTSPATFFDHVRSINGSIKFYESQPYMVGHVTKTKKPENLNILHISSIKPMSTA